MEINLKLIDENEKEISEINMVPFVDIVLVILIIFMATASFIIESKIPLSLPKAKTGETLKVDKLKKLTISVNQRGIYLNSKPISFDSLKRELSKIKDKNTTVVLKIDKNIKFEKVVKIIDICRENEMKNYVIETIRE